MHLRAVPGILAAMLTVGAQQASAQGYNTFIIEVPYEISLPATMKNAQLFCQTIFGPEFGLLAADRYIELENGQAKGSLKFGWDLYGSAPDLDVVGPASLRNASTSPDFTAKVSCIVRRFRDAPSSVFFDAEESGGTYRLSRGEESIILDAVTDPFRLNLTLTHSDNQAGAPAITATTNVAPAQVPSGLQGLQTILDGQ